VVLLPRFPRASPAAGGYRRFLNISVFRADALFLEAIMHRTIKIRRVGGSLGAVLPKLHGLNLGEGDSGSSPATGAGSP
jgi:hypothetical protein